MLHRGAVALLGVVAAVTPWRWGLFSLSVGGSFCLPLSCLLTILFPALVSGTEVFWVIALGDTE